MRQYLNIAEVLLQEKSLGMYLVGGAVRDALLNIPLVDLDFVITNHEIPKVEFFTLIKKHLSPYCIEETLDITDRIEAYKTCKVSFVLATEPNVSRSYDFVFSRAESYSSIGSKPTICVGTLLEDARRRDFSINAMASTSVNVSSETVIDSFGGLLDLDKKIIKILHDKSFEDDPVRLIRATRFKNRFSFQIEEHTEKLMRQAIANNFIEKCTIGRRYFEFLKIFSEKSTFSIIEELQISGLLKNLLGIKKEILLDQLSENAPMLTLQEKLKHFVQLVQKEDRSFVIKNFPISKDFRKELA